jgi:hypothetical protein
MKKGMIKICKNSIDDIENFFKDDLIENFTQDGEFFVSFKNNTFENIEFQGESNDTLTLSEGIYVYKITEGEYMYSVVDISKLFTLEEVIERQKYLLRLHNELREGQALMVALSFFPMGSLKIDLTSIDCFYRDDILPKTLAFLGTVI